MMLAKRVVRVGSRCSERHGYDGAGIVGVSQRATDATVRLVNHSRSAVPIGT